LVAQPHPDVPYPSVLRGLQPAWHAGLGIVMALGLYLLIVPLVSSTVLGLGYVLQRPATSLNDYEAAGRRLEHPVGMLASNLGLAMLTLIAAFTLYTAHRVRPRWLSSVRPGLRWRYLGLCAAAAAAVFAGVLALSGSLSASAATPTQPQLVAFLLIIVITSPLQAAAEEYLFRGYLLQAFGSLAATPWFGVVASALLFALFHGSQNLPLFIDRFAFGLLAAVLAWRTGGLEAGIAAHTANNLLAYGSAALTGSITSLRAIDTISWANAALDIGGFTAFTLVAILLGRGLQNRTSKT
jgi:membrane protease YdiL (CAAX protease family)